MTKQAAEVNISTIGNGVVAELFDHELSKVLANIKDPNTDPKKLRSITLKVTFQPLGDRTGMQTAIECSAKLASVPSVQAGTMFILKNKDGQLQAYSHDIRQEQLFDGGEEKAEEVPANVVSMAKQG